MDNRLTLVYPENGRKTMCVYVRVFVSTIKRRRLNRLTSNFGCIGVTTLWLFHCSLQELDQRRRQETN